MITIPAGRAGRFLAAAAVAVALLADGGAGALAAAPTEEDARQALTELAGKRVWYLKAMASRLQTDDALQNHEYHRSLLCFYGKAGNLEEMSLESIDYANAGLVFRKLDGQSITWEIDIADDAYRYRKMLGLFEKVFVTASPYEEHPDWDDGVWRTIRSGEVKRGMTKAMVYYSFGPPYSTYEDDSWRYMAVIFHFTNGVLTGSGRTMPIHPMEP